MSCHMSHVTCHMSLSKVEKSRQCRAVLSEHFPNACLMDNVFDMLENWPKGKVWSPRELRLVDSFKCCNKEHQENRDMCLAYLVMKETCRYWLDMPCLHIKLLGCLTGAGCFHETPTMLLVWEHHALPTARALTCPN